PISPNSPTTRASLGIQPPFALLPMNPSARETASSPPPSPPAFAQLRPGEEEERERIPAPRRFWDSMCEVLVGRNLSLRPPQSGYGGGVPLSSSPERVRGAGGERDRLV